MHGARVGVSRFHHMKAVSIVTLLCLTVSVHAYAQGSAETSTSPTADIPFAGISPQLSGISESLDAATARALELESEITALEADNRALTERIAVTEQRLVTQQAEVTLARERLDEARARYTDRCIAVYKRGSLDPFTLLLTADSFSELVSRAGVLTRIVEGDSQMVSDLNVALAEARYQQAALDELHDQDKALRTAQEDRMKQLTVKLAEQESIVAQLTVEAREALLTARRFTAETRQQWRLSSIPIGTHIPRASGTVDSRPGVNYIISAYMPRRYRTSGQTFKAVSSWYGPGFNGRGSASGQIFNEDDFTCASRTLPFGTVLALTRGDRHIIVYVNDRGPYIAGRDLDLSKAAATALGFSGVATIDVEIISPVQ